MAENDFRIPVKVDQELNLDCLALGEKGDGICRFNGYVIIVKDAQPDNSYLVRITRVFKKCAFGEII